MLQRVNTITKIVKRLAQKVVGLMDYSTGAPPGGPPMNIQEFLCIHVPCQGNRLFSYQDLLADTVKLTKGNS